MSVREAGVGDAVALAALMTELGYPSSPEQVLARLASLAGEDHVVLLAERGGEVVGAMHLHRAATLASGTIAEIMAFVVHEPVRGEGHGRALLEAADAWARRAGAGELWVRASVWRDKTHAFYAAQGFTMKKEQFVFVRPLRRR